MTKQKVALFSLVEDMSIYPRGAVSEVRVDDLAYALDAGAKLPAVLIDKDTRKIVDGVHRTRAYRKRLGDDAMVMAEVREFADDGAMLLESTRLNKRQGQTLGRWDEVTVYVRAQALGVSDTQVAQALGVTMDRLDRIRIKVAVSDEGPVALKGGMGHMSGHHVTKEQVQELRRQRGATARSKARELTGLLRQGLADVEDPGLLADLAELAAAIAEVLGSAAA